ncbi:hypothetical protein SPRG_14476 [Saprolegnia parasitica CBS 223.65]|uniref:Uncharacterized protein n=1 Tax=Saprolegnia parasitica (strain CBS 223.65) TaxID=695850 RepID=A0A067BTT6_SAPPC|nr:hypothetical protein SPRG_14476 [Saprolegnia parasitica CBS 223.65]KDO20230.1 hypothetical protein SPRG_14476 [Saprolegnia parasitica CBS 223.65]|eukprot:XP_012209043.1 hypothetical protein SPRG_14476 [Saprolegnia parasitica CBS 223.65]
MQPVFRSTGYRPTQPSTQDDHYSQRYSGASQATSYTSEEPQSLSQATTTFASASQEEIVPLPALLHSRYSRMLMNMTDAQRLTISHAAPSSSSTGPDPGAVCASSTSALAEEAAFAKAEQKKRKREQLAAEKQERRHVKEQRRIQVETEKAARRALKQKLGDEKRAKKEAQEAARRLQETTQAEAKQRRRGEKEMLRLEAQKKAQDDATATLLGKVVRRQEKRRIATENEKRLRAVETMLHAAEKSRTEETMRALRMETQINTLAAAVEQALLEKDGLAETLLDQKKAIATCTSDLQKAVHNLVSVEAPMKRHVQAESFTPPPPVEAPTDVDYGCLIALDMIEKARAKKRRKEVAQEY